MENYCLYWQMLDACFFYKIYKNNKMLYFSKLRLNRKPELSKTKQKLKKNKRMKDSHLVQLKPLTVAMSCAIQSRAQLIGLRQLDQSFH